MSSFFGLSKTARAWMVPVVVSSPASMKSRWPSCGVPVSSASPANTGTFDRFSRVMLLSTIARRRRSRSRSLTVK